MNANEPHRLLMSIITGILLMLLACILSGCGTTRKSIRTTGTEIRRDSTAVTVDSQTVNHSEIVNDYLRNTETETLVRLYDTTQPTDSVTGHPPIAAEIIRKTKTKEENRQIAVTADTTHLAVAVNRESTVNTCTEAEETLEKEPPRTLDKLKNLIIAVSGLLLIIAIAYIGIRRNKKT